MPLDSLKKLVIEKGSSKPFILVSPKIYKNIIFLQKQKEINGRILTIDFIEKLSRCFGFEFLADFQAALVCLEIYIYEFWRNKAFDTSPSRIL